mmetsp:Transcript_24828/g.80282  ORF Transcript_24828/g.80282 Transcript_24828/m.80282 type:complete len:227 (+) Transcript_24828:458-1138(+)
MPLSGNSTGSSIIRSAVSGEKSISATSGTYVFAKDKSIDLKFSGEPPNQYWKDIKNDLASLALSPGKYFRTLGNVLKSFNMASSNEPWSSDFFCFMKSPITDLDCPKDAMVKDPSLFKRITSGIDGNTTMASIRSLSAATASATTSASSWTKISDPTKIFAVARSALNISTFFGSRSSSSKYPTHSQLTSLCSFSSRTAADIDAWYCDSRTTYTTLKLGFATADSS